MGYMDNRGYWKFHLVSARAARCLGRVKSTYLVLAGPLILIGNLLAAGPFQENILRYTAPATRWTEALPVGNGRLGAMVFGGARAERLSLNEATFWTGGPKDCNNPAAREVFPKVRQAIAAGNYKEAEALCKKMQGPYNQSYLPLGELKISFPGAGTVTDYSRSRLPLGFLPCHAPLGCRLSRQHRPRDPTSRVRRTRLGVLAPGVQIRTNQVAR